MKIGGLIKKEKHIPQVVAFLFCFFFVINASRYYFKTVKLWIKVYNILFIFANADSLHLKISFYFFSHWLLKNFSFERLRISFPPHHLLLTFIFFLFIHCRVGHQKNERQKSIINDCKNKAKKRFTHSVGVCALEHVMLLLFWLFWVITKSGYNYLQVVCARTSHSHCCIFREYLLLLKHTIWSSQTWKRAIKTNSKTRHLLVTAH